LGGLFISKELPINNEIRDKEVRVVAGDGTQLGVISLIDAKNMANTQNLDLVMISPKARPPVCKIMDYGKYRFELTKKEKEIKKNQKIVSIKEVRLSVNIDTHDFNTKLNQALKFLKGADKVKVSVRFRGREMAHTNLGANLLKKFGESAAEAGTVEKPPKLEGRSMVMFLAPIKDTK
jgi:translation initiation factor IF-3